MEHQFCLPLFWFAMLHGIGCRFLSDCRAVDMSQNLIEIWLPFLIKIWLPFVR